MHAISACSSLCVTMAAACVKPAGPGRSNRSDCAANKLALWHFGIMSWVRKSDANLADANLADAIRPALPRPRHVGVPFLFVP
jgi:hypothetical protein